jgi:hypothetical protein
MSDYDIIEHPPNWMRCMVIRDKDKEHIANIVMFHDGTIVVHWLTGKTDVYPDGNAATRALGGTEYSFRYEEVTVEL